MIKIIKSKANFVDQILDKTPGLVHRGMSRDELANIIKSRKIESKGEGNVGKSQEGLTYFSKEPYVAGVYATDFAKRDAKPTEDRPAFVVSVKSPKKGKIKKVEGTGKHEVGVKGSIPIKDIVHVHMVKKSGGENEWEKLTEEPLHLYHGTGHLFRKFDPGKARTRNDYYGGGAAYLTDNPVVASGYANAGRRKTGNGYIYKVKTDLKNVFDTTKMHPGESVAKMLPDDVESFARSAGLLKYGTNKHQVIANLKAGKTPMSGDDIFKGLSRDGQTHKAREHLKKLGFDGLKHVGGMIAKGRKHNVYIPYSSDDIKIDKILRIKKKNESR